MYSVPLGAPKATTWFHKAAYWFAYVEGAGGGYAESKMAARAAASMDGP